MKIINSNSLGKCWQQILKAVYRQGKIILNNEGNIKELLDLIIFVKNISEDALVRRYGNRAMIQWMKNNFNKKTPIRGWGYSYGSRIKDFQGFNQMSVIIKKLKNNPHSKSSIIGLILPAEDKQHVPCLIALDFKIRNKNLITTAFFRSQDVGEKFCADALAIKSISERIAKPLNYPLGQFVFFIKSAHIYLSDLDAVDKILNNEPKTSRK